MKQNDIKSGTPIIDLNSENSANELMEAIGAKPGDTVQIRTPQFDRTDGEKVALPLSDPKFWQALGGYSVDDLKNCGFQAWDDDPVRGKLMLFPAEWYDHIPDGYRVVDINYEVEHFKRGVTDDDRRFGALSYGILKVPQ